MLVNVKTGESFIPDQAVSRLNRMRRRVYAWAKELKDLDVRRVMITLTYRPGVDWAPGHIREFMLRVRKDLGKGLLAYSWVAELQERGAVHYHVILVMSRGVRCKNGEYYWKHGLTRTEEARTVFYIASYASKVGQKGLSPDGPKYPKGLRSYAVWIRKGLLAKFELFRFRLSTYPRWIERIVEDTGVLGRRLTLEIRRLGDGLWQVGTITVWNPWVWM